MGAPAAPELAPSAGAALAGDALDARVRATVQGSWLGLFLGELFQGSGQLALLLLLLEAVGEWDSLWVRPDIYVLSAVALGQSAWLAWRLRSGVPLGWWNRVLGLVLYVLVETALEGMGFFVQARHITFALLTLVYAGGMQLEMRAWARGWQWLGVMLARTAQGLAPLLFYVALDLRDQGWWPGWQEFLQSPAHVYLVALGLTQVAALTALALVAGRQQRVIAGLVEQLKTLSRWGFGGRVVEAVLRDSRAQAAQRVERAIAFIDVRGFTAWSEAHTPEEVMAMLNRFYAAALQACGDRLIKSKMSGDEVLLVLPAGADVVGVVQAALGASLQAVQPLGLSVGAGVWLGPVVEGFFGAQEAQIHDVIGDTVNTAKRLCDHAQGGQLLAGPMERVAPAAPDSVSIQAKGKHQPVRAAVFGIL